jgi:hypothetical protein
MLLHIQTSRRFNSDELEITAKHEMTEKNGRRSCTTMVGSVESIKIQLKLCLCGVACQTKLLIAEFQLIFKLTLDELQVLFTNCRDVKKERNSDGGMALSK